MAFTLEDGTGVEGANALVSIDFVDAYFADRGGNALWDDLTPEDLKEEAIVRATDYVEKVNEGRWKGTKNTSTQGLNSSPRYGIYIEQFLLPSDEVPLGLKQAIAEYAARTTGVSIPLLSDPDVPVGSVRRTYEKIGPMAETIEYTDVGNSVLTAYPDADFLLSPFLVSPGGRTVKN